MTTRVTLDREIREDRPVQPTIHVSRPLQRLPVLVGLLTLVSALTLAVQNEAHAQTLPVISIVSDSYFAYERDTASWTLTASPAPSAALTVQLNVTEFEEYSGVVPSNKLGSQTFTFPANQTSATYTISLLDSSNVATSGGQSGDPRVGRVTVELSKGTGYTVGKPTDDYANVYDWRFAPVEVSISRVASPITEGGTAQFTITADSAPMTHRDVRVLVADSGDFAVSGQAEEREVHLAAGATTTTLTVTTDDDITHESPGTITATLLPHALHLTVGSPNSATVNVNDNDDPPPTVTISADSASVTEGSPAVFTVTANPAPAANLTVRVRVTQSGDYTSASYVRTHNVVIAASTTTKKLTIATINDTDDEADGSVTATINTDNAYTKGTPSWAQTAVTDNDDPPPQPSVSFALASSSAAESAGTRNVTVNLSPAAPSGGLNVSYSVTGTATAGNGNDFTIQNSGTLSVTAGATTATIPVAINDDSTVESSETVILTLTRGTGYTPGSTTTHTLTITDNDDPPPQPSVSFALASSSAAESAGTRNVTVNLSPAAPSGGLNVSYSVTGTATAGNGNDFTIQNSGTLSVTAGATTATIPVAINDDSTVESSETVILTLTRGTGYTPGSTTTHTLTITDNDDPPPQPSVSFALASSSAAESAGTRNVTVNLSPAAPSGGLNVSYSVTGTATAGNGKDFTIQNSGTLSVTAGATTATIPVAINDDSTVESSETVILTLTNGTGYTPGNTTTHTLTITDNDSKATLSLSGPASANEGNSGTSDKYFTVSLSKAASRFVSWQLCFAGTATIDVSGGGTIPAAADYQPISGQSPINLTGRNPVCTDRAFSPPFSSLTNTDVGIRIKGDTDSESAETVIVTLKIDDGPSDVILGTSAVTYTIGDDDSTAQPAASFALASSSAAESAGTHNVRVSLSPAAPSGGLSVSYSVAGTAAAGSGKDYTIQNSGTLSVAAGATTATIPVAINDDSTVESSETVILTLTRGTGYTLGSTTAHTLTITDNDAPPPSLSTVTITRQSASVPEGTSAVFTVSANPAPAANLTVRLRVTDSGFFVRRGQTGSRTATIASGQSTATLTVTTDNDTTDENDGDITVVVSTDSAYTTGSPSWARTAVRDDDAPSTLSTVTITRQSASVPEGTDAVFTVTANPAPSAKLTVRVAVTKSGDYISASYVKTHDVVIAASATTKQLVIPTINDSNDEANGWVTASINTDSAYTRGSPSSVRTNITDDDDANANANNNGVYAPPQPSRTTGNTGPRRQTTATTAPATTTTTTATPESNTGSGSGSSGASDSSGSSGGGSSDDDDGGGSSGDGGVAPSVSSAGDGGQSSGDPEPVTPTGPVVLEVVGGAGVEEGEDAVFTITASRAPATDLTVTVFVDRDGNFVAGRERGTKTTLLLAGQTSVVYRVPTLDGNADEPNGAVLLSLKPGSGYEIGEPSAASVAVADNDPGDYDRNSAPPQPTSTTQPPPAASEPGDSNAAAPAAPSGGGGDLVELLPAALTEEPDPPQTSTDPPPDIDPIDDELDAETETEGHDEEDQEVLSAPIPGDNGNEPGTAESTGGAVSPIVPLTMIAVIAASIGWLFFASRRRAGKPQYSASPEPNQRWAYGEHAADHL